MPEPAFVHTAKVTVGAARGGVELTNFDELDVVIDMLAPGSPFSITFWFSSVRGNASWVALRRLCKIEETVRVVLDDAEQLHGRIERVAITTGTGGRGGRTLTVSGRDFAARAMVTDADPTIKLKGTRLGEALELLFRDCYAVPVVLATGAEQVETQARPRRSRGTSTSATTRRPRRPRVHKVDGFTINAGDKTWDLGVRLTRRSGNMLWAAPVAGQTAGLVVDVPTETGPTLYTFDRRTGPNGTLAGNILESTHTFDGADVPTHVGVFHDGPLDANDDAHGYERVANEWYIRHPMTAHEGTLSGSLIPKHRYLHPDHVRTRQDAEKIAERCVAEAAADFEVLELQVRGWGQVGPDGVRRLYAVNALARAIDETDEPALDAVMLITRVHFHRSRARGTTTDLRLVPVGAIRVLPVEGP